MRHHCGKHRVELPLVDGASSKQPTTSGNDVVQDGARVRDPLEEIQEKLTDSVK